MPRAGSLGNAMLGVDVILALANGPKQEPDAVASWGGAQGQEEGLQLLR